jgi:hypothetical protein
MRRHITALPAVLVAITLAVTACGKKGATPTEVLKAFAEARMKGDGDAMKRMLSKSYLKKAEETARQKGVSVGELLAESARPPAPETCHTEKVEGDRAIVECGESAAFFIKEDGEWKFNGGGYQ